MGLSTVKLLLVAWLALIAPTLALQGFGVGSWDDGGDIQVSLDVTESGNVTVTAPGGRVHTFPPNVTLSQIRDFWGVGGAGYLKDGNGMPIPDDPSAPVDISDLPYELDIEATLMDIDSTPSVNARLSKIEAYMEKIQLLDDRPFGADSGNFTANFLETEVKTGFVDPITLTIIGLALALVVKMTIAVVTQYMESEDHYQNFKREAARVRCENLLSSYSDIAQVGRWLRGVTTLIRSDEKTAGALNAMLDEVEDMKSMMIPRIRSQDTCWDQGYASAVLAQVEATNTYRSSDEDDFWCKASAKGMFHQDPSDAFEELRISSPPPRKSDKTKDDHDLPQEKGEGEGEHSLSRRNTGDFGNLDNGDDSLNDEEDRSQMKKMVSKKSKKKKKKISGIEATSSESTLLEVESEVESKTTTVRSGLTLFNTQSVGSMFPEGMNYFGWYLTDLATQAVADYAASLVKDYYTKKEETLRKITCESMKRRYHMQTLVTARLNFIQRLLVLSPDVPLSHILNPPRHIIQGLCEKRQSCPTAEIRLPKDMPVDVQRMVVANHRKQMIRKSVLYLADEHFRNPDKSSFKNDFSMEQCFSRCKSPSKSDTDFCPSLYSCRFLCVMAQKIITPEGAIDTRLLDVDSYRGVVNFMMMESVGDRSQQLAIVEDAVDTYCGASTLAQLRFEAAAYRAMEGKAELAFPDPASCSISSLFILQLLIRRGQCINADDSVDNEISLGEFCTHIEGDAKDEADAQKMTANCWAIVEWASQPVHHLRMPELDELDDEKWTFKSLIKGAKPKPIAYIKQHLLQWIHSANEDFFQMQKKRKFGVFRKRPARLTSLLTLSFASIWKRPSVFIDVLTSDLTTNTDDATRNFVWRVRLYGQLVRSLQPTVTMASALWELLGLREYNFESKADTPLRRLIEIAESYDCCVEKGKCASACKDPELSRHVDKGPEEAIIKYFSTFPILDFSLFNPHIYNDISWHKVSEGRLSKAYTKPITLPFTKAACLDCVPTAVRDLIAGDGNYWTFRQDPAFTWIRRIFRTQNERFEMVSGLDLSIVQNSCEEYTDKHIWLRSRSQAENVENDAPTQYTKKIGNAMVSWKQTITRDSPKHGESMKVKLIVRQLDSYLADGMRFEVADYTGTLFVLIPGKEVEVSVVGKKDRAKSGKVFQVWSIKGSTRKLVMDSTEPHEVVDQLLTLNVVMS